MKKSKTLLATLLACPLLLAGCNSSQPSQPASSSTSGQPSGNTLSEMFDAFLEKLSAQNLTYRMKNDSDTPYGRSKMDQLIKIDGNKAYVYSENHRYNPEMIMTAENYFEFGEPTYRYAMQEDHWVKEVVDVKYNYIRPSGTMQGFTTFVPQFKASATPTDDGYAVSSINVTVNVRDVVEASGDDPNAYEYTVDTINLTYSNVKVSVENGLITSLHFEANGIEMEKHDNICTVVVREQILSKTDFYDITNIGTTSVTLPNI